jgi:hypothetical protein
VRKGTASTSALREQSQSVAAGSRSMLIVDQHGPPIKKEAGHHQQRKCER